MDNSTGVPENLSCITTTTKGSLVTIVLYTTVAVIQIFLIIFSNFLILASIIKFPRLRLTSNILIANLAISDLLVGFILLPLNIVGVLDPTFIDTIYGCTWRGFNWVFVFGSGFLSLFLISIDRLAAITAPLKYKVSNTKPIAIGLCFMSWFIWFLVCTLSFFIVNVWQCNVLCTLSNVMPKLAFQFIAFTLGILFAGSCVSFLVILRYLLTYDNRNISRGAKDAKRKTGVMALVFGLFVLFLIPLIASAVYASSVNTITNRMFVDWLILMAGANSVVNGIIYGLKRPEFRKAYLTILGIKTTNIVVPATTEIQVSTLNN